ncbi:hypothetical protein CKK34_6040 [Yarrowia sp. E02]|nr:hypothetical protein CKK34_6040 [Yarrowia sp. E02]
MIRGIRVFKWISPGLSRDLRRSHVNLVSSPFPNSSPAFNSSPFSTSNSLQAKRKNTKFEHLPDGVLPKDFLYAVQKLVKQTESKEKNANDKNAKKVNYEKVTKQTILEMESSVRDSSSSAASVSALPQYAESPVPTALQHLLSTSVTKLKDPSLDYKKAIKSASPVVLRSYVEQLCLSQPHYLLISSLQFLMSVGAYGAAQITLHYLLERAQVEKDLYNKLQLIIIKMCNNRRPEQPVSPYFMRPSNLIDPKKVILPFILNTSIRMAKDEGHLTSYDQLMTLTTTRNDGTKIFAKLGHTSLFPALKHLYHYRPRDLLHFLENNPEQTHLVAGYVMTFATLIVSTRKFEKQYHRHWGKVLLHLSKNQPLEWYIWHERLLRSLSASFWGSVISRKHSPPLSELRKKVGKMPPSQAIWIQATLMTNELAHANALVEDMLNEGFAATEEIGQHLVKLFTRDMDPVVALDVIDDLHQQYGTYISLHTTFFSHWCRTRNSRAVLSMVKVLKSRNQMTKEFYIQAFERLLKNGDFQAALYLAETMSRDSELDNHITAGEFLSAALYRGRQSVFPSSSATKTDLSDLMTEGMRYHLHVDKFAGYISKFNESREESTTRLPVHVTLRYLNELHKRGLYASVEWYQYNLEMMQTCAFTQPEVEVFLRGLSRLLSLERCISRNFDREFADIIAQSEAIVVQINERRSKQKKGLVEEEPSSAVEVAPVIKESTSAFSDGSGKADGSGNSDDSGKVSDSDTSPVKRQTVKTPSVKPPCYKQVFASPYFQFETVKWGAIKSPKDPGSGVRILNGLKSQSKSNIRPYVVTEAIRHVATKLYITTPPSYRRLRAQTSFNMEEFLQRCDEEWRRPVDWKT